MNTNEHSEAKASTPESAIFWASKGQRRKIFGISRRTNDADIAEGIKNGTLRVKSFGPRCLRIAVPLADIPAGGIPHLRRLQEQKSTATAKAVTRASKPLTTQRRAAGKAVRS